MSSEPLRAVPLARRVPFQQSLTRNHYPPARADDRVQAEKCLVGETHQLKCSLNEASPGRALRAAMCWPKSTSPGFRSISSEGAQRGNKQDADHRQGPKPAADKTVQPNSNRRVNPAETRCGASCRRFSIWIAPRADSSGRCGPRAGNTWQQPPGNVPIPANPTVSAAHVGARARGVFFV